MDWEMTCALCQISGKSRRTGPLLTHDHLTVHENCLLYSSGLFCHDSQVDDELLGFSVEAVKKEIARGSKLMCHLCKQKGATVGCEVKRCKRSYHYPCAINDKAEKVKDSKAGTYMVYCEIHCPEIGASGKTSSSKAGRPSSLNGHSDKPEHPKGETSSMKITRVTDNVDDNIFTLHYEKLSKTLDGMGYGEPVAGPSPPASHSHTPKHSKHTSTKKPPSPDMDEEVIPSPSSLKRRRIMESSSDSDDDESVVNMECAPLDSDLEGSGPSEQVKVPETQHQPSHSKDAETPVASTSGRPSPPQNEDVDGNDDTFIDSDAESQSLLLPVVIIPLDRVDRSSSTAVSGSPPPDIPAPADDRPSHPLNVLKAQSYPVLSSRLRSGRGPASLPSPTAASSPPHPRSLPPSPDAPVDSADFWRNCNQAGCTEAIFDGFIADMLELYKRIVTNQASQEDYDVSLGVLKASGKLNKLVSQLGKEREKNLKEAKESLSAINKAWSILKR